MRSFTSRLNFVDLAGSERLEYNGNTAKTREESININKSLFNLKKVMTALAEGGVGGSHIPYRDSKLTCMLQPTLGGSGSCLMVLACNEIGCVDMDENHFEDTVSTLIFAYKASSIVNTVVKEEDSGFGIVEGLRKRVAELEAELNRAFVQIETLSNLLDKTAFLEDSPLLPKSQKDSNNSTSVLNRLVEQIDDIRNKGEQSRSTDAPSLNRPFQMGAPSKVDPSDQNLKQQFLQSLSMVKELLVSNQSLRDELNQSEESTGHFKREISALIVAQANDSLKIRS